MTLHALPKSSASPDAAPAPSPFDAPWTTPFGAPPFADIGADAYRPAFARALDLQAAEIAAIAGDPEPPSFANTIEALERAGRELDRVGGVFFNLAGASSDEALREIERELSPVLAARRADIMLNGALFARVADLYARRDALGLTLEQARLLERTHARFARAGAGLDETARARLKAIAEEAATLGTRFAQNLLAEEEAWTLTLAEAADLDGLPAFAREAFAREATERGVDALGLVTLARPSVETFLTHSRRRDLRERVWRAFTARGEASGNPGIGAALLRLRAERAGLLGFPSFAAYRLADAMARTPEAARELLLRVWPAARAKALAERAELETLAAAEDGLDRIEPWDWRHYAERVRRARFDLDEAEVKPFFPLARIVEAAFDTASRLFGLSFTPRPEVPAYHPDLRVHEVRDADGRHLGLFLGDDFARPGKRSGAWMSEFRGQERLDGEVRPIVVNVMNFSRGAPGEPALLSFDDARTLFHEFGHALHGLLSDVTYPSLAGTSVPRDFVEFPSQLYEHWLERPEVLARFARHAVTGEPMPGPLLDRLLAARNFGQGFRTVEYLACAILDLDLHGLPEPGEIDLGVYEREALAVLGMPEGIAMRHRLPQFAHVFSGDGYAAGYYSYMWSEVLDADGFGAFEEAGDPFDPETAARLRRFVYAAGDLREPGDAYLAFRGREPEVAALLRGRGLVEA